MDSIDFTSIVAEHEKEILDKYLNEKLISSSIVLIANPTHKRTIADCVYDIGNQIYVLWSEAVEPDKIYQVTDKYLKKALMNCLYPIGGISDGK